MSVSSLAIFRLGFLLTSLLALSGSAAQLIVSSRLQSDFENNQKFCRLYLCDERTVARYAYQQQIEGGSTQVRTAIQILGGVVFRDPASAERWIDLGEAYAAAGQSSEARRCIARALELGSTSADVLIPAGHYLLQAGDRREGIRELARALALTSTFDAIIFSYFAAEQVAVPELLEHGVLDDRRVAQSYLRFTLGKADLGSAQTVWKWVHGHALEDDALTTEYVNFLIAQKHFADAAGIWAAQFAYQVPGYRTTEYVYDGNFDREPIPAAFFDWRFTPCENVEIAREATAGASSLHLRFDGSRNLDFRHVSQNSVLPPGRYRFRARVRTESLTTDQGVFFRIADSEAPSRLSVETTPSLGTADWHTIDTTFLVGSGTRLVEVSVNRRASMRFDSKINGSIWIAGVSLAPL